MQILYWSLLTVCGFLVGGVMFCALIPQRVLHKDIVKISADGNPGAYNVFKHCGIITGIPCLILDVAKGFVPVFAASMLMENGNPAFACVMIAPVLGHAVGVFNRFRGGKGIAASFGVMLGLIPVTWVCVCVLAGLFVVLSVAPKINPASKRCVIVYALFAVIACTFLVVMKRYSAAAGTAVVALIPIVKFLGAKNKKGCMRSAENRTEAR